MGTPASAVVGSFHNAPNFLSDTIFCYNAESILKRKAQDFVVLHHLLMSQGALYTAA